MKILFDENMPFAANFFGDFYGQDTELVPFNGRKLTAEQAKDADILLVRSVTKVNRELLALNQQLKFVGTATIGVDHIDQDYLAERNIAFTSSPGCNAISVAEYVVSALVVLSERYLTPFLNKTVGIVGGGNTGSRVSEKLAALGMDYKICDPLLEAAGDPRKFSSLEEVLACDIITLHVPKTMSGSHPTFHLLNHDRLSKLRDDQILINACRGEVIDNNALLALKEQGLKTKLVLDVWENEPHVLMSLIPYAEIATAHIAGYSIEGRSRGTEMLYHALCKLENKTPDKLLTDFLSKPLIAQCKINYPFDEVLLNQMVKIVYDVRRDDAIFRQQVSNPGFDHIRKTYPPRREFSSLSITGQNPSELTTLFSLGFNQNI